MLMTPSEAEAVCKAYNEFCDKRNRDEWERARTLACIVVQPHVRRKLTPSSLLTFPWDNEHKHTAEIASKEDDRMQFAETLRKARACGAIK